MKNYTITVNGVSYDVTVEENNGSVVSAPVAPPVATPVTPKTPIKTETKATGSVSVKAPMPGTIVKINVKSGDTVKSGSVLCVLEAMKMENDIVAPQDGVIASINTTQGASVATDELLFSMN